MAPGPVLALGPRPFFRVGGARRLRVCLRSEWSRLPCPLLTLPCLGLCGVSLPEEEAPWCQPGLAYQEAVRRVSCCLLTAVPRRPTPTPNSRRRLCVPRRWGRAGRGLPGQGDVLRGPPGRGLPGQCDVFGGPPGRRLPGQCDVLRGPPGRGLPGQRDVLWGLSCALVCHVSQSIVGTHYPDGLCKARMWRRKESVVAQRGRRVGDGDGVQPEAPAGGVPGGA